MSPVSVIVSVDDAVEGLLELEADAHESGGAIQGGPGLVQHDGRGQVVQLLDGAVEEPEGRKSLALVGNGDGLLQGNRKKLHLLFHYFVLTSSMTP